jgi:hypothetical protein
MGEPLKKGYGERAARFERGRVILLDGAGGLFLVTRRRLVGSIRAKLAPWTCGPADSAARAIDVLAMTLKPA